MRYEDLGFDIKISWKGEELVLNSKSEESVKRFEDYTGLHVSKVCDDVVIYTSDYFLEHDIFDILRYVGKSERPIQPIGLRYYDYLFSEWKGKIFRSKSLGCFGGNLS